MAITPDQVQEFSTAIAELYEHILLSNFPQEPAYKAYIDAQTPFALGDHGYRVSYLGLLRAVFQLPRISDKWSEDSVEELGHDLLLSLAQYKKRAEGIPDFPQLAREWLGKIDVEFNEFLCYTAVAGLSVDVPLELGDVTFLPADVQRTELEDKAAASFRRHLSPLTDSLSCSKVTAEWRRASQIHRQKTEYALNAVRFIGSLVWHDQATRHTYIASQDPKRISDSLVIAPSSAVFRVGASEFTPLPITLDSETIQYAQFYGLQDIQSLLRAPTPSELQLSLLTAIQWFGQATQELLPLVAFVKYYISIEAALKKQGEKARSVLPRRLSVLIEPWDKSRQARLELDLQDFIDERNAVFHSGVPLASSPERLSWDARILARQALHQLRLRLKSEGWQSKDDLKAWIASQYQNHLV